jgi:hypothetical protein
MRIKACCSYWIGMETPSVLLAATGLLAVSAGSRLIQVRGLAHRIREHIERTRGSASLITEVTKRQRLQACSTREEEE